MANRFNPPSVDPSIFGLPREERNAIRRGAFRESLFRRNSLASLEDDGAPFPRNDYSTNFPGIRSYSDFEFRLRPVLQSLGVRWVNYGFDPSDGFIMNFHSAEQAVAAKLAYEGEDA